MPPPSTRQRGATWGKQLGLHVGQPGSDAAGQRPQLNLPSLRFQPELGAAVAAREAEAGPRVTHAAGLSPSPTSVPRPRSELYLGVAAPPAAVAPPVMRHAALGLLILAGFRQSKEPSHLCSFVFRTVGVSGWKDRG